VKLAVFNQLSPAEARRQLLTCCSAPRWAQAVAEGRPYRSAAALQAAAEAALTDADLDDGMAGHPRIGERSRDARSRREQSRVADADAAVLDALAEGNRRYEQRFGHVYLVCASGRDADELLEVLHSRLDNDEATERTVARRELAAINRLRLGQLLSCEETR
jgi:2-oxo-4-hydroxy-4-carboxy-5-ureidoimidazoline decarboxylase